MIGRVQAHLETIYDLETVLRAQEFLVTREAASALGYTGRSSEELLVRQDGEELELALYLAPEVLARLAPYDSAPPEHLVDGALEPYLHVAEGVSHFLYLVRAAEHDRRVSMLELEAQAEVDKFALCVLSGWRRGLDWARHLLQRLFHWVSFLPTLAAEERWRYEEANRLSRNYCARLLRHVARDRMDSFLSDLRYCYRLGAEAKLRHLASE